MKRKGYKQKSKRRIARWRDNHEKRNSVFTWKNGLYGKPKRIYVIFDDTSKIYVSQFSPFVRGVGTSKTASKAYKFDSVDDIIRVLNQIKHTGAWRTIRVS